MEDTNPNQEDWELPHEFEEASLPEWPRDAFPDQAQQYIKSPRGENQQ